MEKNTRNHSLVIAALAAVLVVMLFVFRTLAVELVYPVERAVRSAGGAVCRYVGGMFRGAAANVENRRLRAEIDFLAVLQGDIERLEHENAELRKTLGYVRKAPARWIAAPVLSAGGPAAGARNVLRVGRGSLDGVRANAMVTAADGLVGRVGSVTFHTATVVLLTDPQMAVACAVEGAPNSRGVVFAGSGENLEMRFVPTARSLPPRARVVTTGEGGLFAAGVPVGTVAGLGGDAQDLVPPVEIEPAVDFSSLENVFIRREE